MIKKSLVIVLTLLAASTMIYEVSSYTRAQVNNNATLKVVDSDKALIAVSSKINISNDDINSGSKAIRINNNLSRKITKIDIKFNNDKNEVIYRNLKLIIDDSSDNKINYNGNVITKNIKIQKLEQGTDSKSNKPLSIKIKTEWEGGNTELTSNLNIEQY